MRKTFGVTMWEINDIKNIKPNWSDKKCENFLIEIEDDLIAAMINEGWHLIEERMKDYEK